MKKTTKKSTSTKSKSAVKSRAAASKKKPIAAKKNVASKTVKRKGVRHHVKRAFHSTPKFVHGMIAGAFVGVLLVTSLGITGTSGAEDYPQADPCIKVTDGINVNNQNANATVKLAAGCGKRTFVMKSWYAMNDQGGKYGKYQVLYATTKEPVTLTPKSEPTKIHVPMFNNDCFYQVDLVDMTGSKPWPIPKAAVGGIKDCRPDQTHSYACSALGLTSGPNRSVTISNFAVATNNATFTDASIDWGDGTGARTANVKGSQHTYAVDKTYSVAVTANFTYTGRVGNVRDVTAPPCTAQVTYTTVPPGTEVISVCEIATKQVLSIDKKLYGTVRYPTDKYTEDLDSCIVTTVAVTPASLAKTGPEAILIIIGFAIMGGFVFHKGHRHIKNRRQYRMIG